MSDVQPPAEGPPVEEVHPLFQVYEARTEGDRLLYYGEPRVSPDVLERRLWPLFRERGYQVTLTRQTGEHVLVAEPHSTGVGGVPWTNVGLAVATLLTTLWAGATWYYVPIEGPLDLLQGWPFAAAVLGVFGVHEFGHYLLSRYHGVDASLPYFIPFPVSFIGTMGAVIRIRGRIPDRKALFDIGVAGPLAGLVTAILVTVVGLYLPPITVPEWVLSSPSATEIHFNHPLIFQWLSDLTGQPLRYDDPRKSVNPVIFGGWVGMFITFLNLLPVGQLDGGHIVRAMLGRRQETVAAFVPVGLFALAAYLYYVLDAAANAVGIWVLWGVFALGIAYVGPASPVDDSRLDGKRIAVGVLTFGLGLLCFTPVPIEIVG